jgi:DNA mismatch repair protein MutS2
MSPFCRQTLEEQKRLQRAVQELEFAPIVAMFAHHTQTDRAGQALLGLRPPEDLKAHFDTLNRWSVYLEAYEPMVVPPLPLDSLFQRVIRLDPLDREELLVFQRVFQVFMTLCRSEHPSPIGFSKQTLQESPEILALSARLDELFDDRGQWTKAVSPKYAKGLDQWVRLEHQMAAQFQHILRQQADLLSEPVLFTRQDRTVLGVLSSYQRRIPGIVVDYSGTGQTVFIEPAFAVALRNQMTEVQRSLDEELFRVRLELSERIFAMDSLRHRILPELERMDFFQTCCRLMTSHRLVPICPDDSGRVVVHQARHPFLDPCFAEDRRRHGLSEGSSDALVPLSLTLSDPSRALVISGANTGGKTVALKTIGVLVLLSHLGLPVPLEEGSVLPHVSAVFCDIGDHQSLSQNLSTYAGHLTHLKEVLGYCRQEPSTPALVLLDELGSGTDPNEGNAIAQAVLENLVGPQSWVFLTTHQQALCAFAVDHPAIENASMSFDQNRFKPTYALQMGVPGRSHALDIAQKLGFDEQLIQRSRQLIRQESLALHQILVELQEKAQLLEKQRLKLKKEERRCARRAAENREEAQRLEATQRVLREKERTRLEKTVAKVERELRGVLQDVASNKQRQKVVSQFKEVVQAVLPEDHESTGKREMPQASGLPWNAWQPGDGVWVKSWGKAGILEKLARKSLEVRLNGLLMTLTPDDVIHLQQATQGSANAKVTVFSPERPESGLPLSLSLRGMNKEEALRQLESSLQRAILEHPPCLVVIHGHGDGVLKKAVRQYLQQHPFSSHWGTELSRENDGQTTVAFSW